ncbi:MULTISPECIES: nuclear transport factor 2 family protein [unclassified Sphingopyxis]|uniref:nuclear transport factor 2 family protein n=1 Tax=unclassified Sphingopyxis TaxID=2614943 RepID=UPI0012E3D5CD|nr:MULTISPECIES: nuclear transport factor 2 family protein [unclassified Sphingopyxis]
MSARWMALMIALASVPAMAQSAPTASPETIRDGQRDFDFEIGEWSTEVRVLTNPLSGKAPVWAEYRGTSLVRGLMDGRANSVELTVAGPAGKIEGISLRLYDPATRRWSLNFASLRDGAMTPPVIGTFGAGGRGVFTGADKLGERPIRVRFVITQVSPDEAHFEQAFSIDNGVTWEVNWIAVDRRRPSSAPTDTALPPDLAAAIEAHNRATMAKDITALGELVTDDYLLVNSDAKTQDKRSYLADFEKPDFRIEPFVIEAPTRRVHGDTAMSGGLVTLRWTLGGQHQSRRLRIAHMWVRQNGRWQIAYTQLTRVPG